MEAPVVALGATQYFLQLRQTAVVLAVAVAQVVNKKQVETVVQVAVEVEPTQELAQQVEQEAKDKTVELVAEPLEWVVAVAVILSQALQVIHQATAEMELLLFQRGV
jgi:uncharacterized ferredoxin-like protein